MDNKQCIRCTVVSCIFQNEDYSTCSLEEVNVGTTDPDDVAFDINETVCKSFLARDNEEFATEYHFEE